MLLDLWFHHTFVKPKPKTIISVGGAPLNLPLLLNRKDREELVKFNDDEEVVELVYALFAARLI